MTTIDPAIDPPALDAAAALAATAAGSVTGVHSLGSLLGRASDAVRERVGLASTAPGVKIDTDRADSVTATISLVVDYPHKLHEVSDAVRTAVRDALEPLGRGRIDVDVVVTGVFGPFDRDVVDEAEQKADAVSARARDVAGDVKERTDAVAARASEAVDDMKAKSKDVAAGASAAVDDAVTKSRDLAASASETVDVAVARSRDVAAGAAAAVEQTVQAPRERVASADADIAAADRVTEGLEPESPVTSTPADDRGDVRDVVAEALEDAAVDLAIAADEVRTDDETPATDSVQSVVEDDRPRS
ncbi:Asp23/Gls24 family envelope stress response protein [Microbacterium sp. CFBP 8790]|uniref:Asp23/Gls24 family envelope stress response protein n=1 Tax=unclassified Microbacterium TaxID=2609290 RepID=UPI00177AE4AD|nr:MULTISPECIES: Asp23/Gls24 family envelope stress response protein [unclassified Microbacterium]MBD8207600.1 Asp23/Gls24 family envelope stress response protein [Microbacterium sp. CFBP 8801]MBD8508983.1 Asp23/Gls24 family envelope stress response protein [Microbacterium sp. CFBP 8790]